MIHTSCHQYSSLLLSLDLPSVCPHGRGILSNDLHSTVEADIPPRAALKILTAVTPWKAAQSEFWTKVNMACSCCSRLVKNKAGGSLLSAVHKRQRYGSKRISTTVVSKGVSCRTRTDGMTPDSRLSTQYLHSMCTT
jgi:hypothetical protein